MKYRTVLITAFSLIATLGHTDVIELKNGKKLTGKYAGGTASSVGFETSGGMQFFDTGQIVSLSFGDSSTAKPSGTAPTSAAPAPAAPAAAGAAAPATGNSTGGAVSIPAGTALLVRTMDPVSSSDPQGKRFAATRESDLV